MWKILVGGWQQEILLTLGHYNQFLHHEIHILFRVLREFHTCGRHPCNTYLLECMVYEISPLASQKTKICNETGWFALKGKVHQFGMIKLPDSYLYGPILFGFLMLEWVSPPLSV